MIASQTIAQQILNDINREVDKKINRGQLTAQESLNLWGFDFLEEIIKTQSYTSDEVKNKKIDECPEFQPTRENKIISLKVCKNVPLLKEKPEGRGQNKSSQGRRSRTVSKQIDKRMLSNLSVIKFPPKNRFIELQKQKASEKLIINQEWLRKEDRLSDKEKQDHKKMRLHLRERIPSKVSRLSIEGKDVNKEKQGKSFGNIVVLQYHISHEKKVRSLSHHNYPKICHIQNSNVQNQPEKSYNAPLKQAHQMLQKKMINKKEDKFPQIRKKLSLKQTGKPQKLQAETKKGDVMNVVNFERKSLLLEDLRQGNGSRKRISLHIR